MIISLIVAVDRNNVIGNRGRLPWPRMDADMQHFRELTRGHPVIMGRKTYESIGHPLPDRPNIVVSSQKELKIEGCDVVDGLDAALERARSYDSREIFFIGGGELYRQAIGEVATRIELTRIEGEFEGDAFFPEISGKEWKEISREEHEADEENPYPYAFLTYEKRKKNV